MQRKRSNRLRGLADIRGEQVDDLVVMYTKKASAAAELQKALDGK